MGGHENDYALIVEECGGLDRLEELQRHQNADIYSKAVRGGAMLMATRAAWTPRLFLARR